VVNFINSIVFILLFFVFENSVFALPFYAFVSNLDRYSLFIDDEGNVSTVGVNKWGRMGCDAYLYQNNFDNDNFIELHHPNVAQISAVNLGLSSKIVSVVATSCTSLFLDEDGRVFFAGLNALDTSPSPIAGDAEWNDERARAFLNKCSFSPKLLPFDLPRIQEIAGYQRSFLFLDIDGNVWTGGSNYLGQLGFGDTKERSGMFRLEGLPTIQAILPAQRRHYLIDVEGHLWFFGKTLINREAVKPTRIFPKSTARFTMMAAKCEDILAADDTNTLWYGRLRDAEPTIFATQLPFSPTMLATLDGALREQFFILNSEGQVWSFEPANQFHEARLTPIQIDGEPFIKAIFQAGAQNLFLLDDKGQLWENGNNVHSQLRIHATLDRFKVIPLGFTIAPLPSRRIKSAASLSDGL
jgi:alpha-tubulin suppressor-like RCC1 family protein